MSRYSRVQTTARATASRKCTGVAVEGAGGGRWGVRGIGDGLRGREDMMEEAGRRLLCELNKSLKYCTADRCVRVVSMVVLSSSLAIVSIHLYSWLALQSITPTIQPLKVYHPIHTLTHRSMVHIPLPTIHPTVIVPPIPPPAFESLPLLCALVQQHIIVTRLPCFISVIIGLFEHDAKGVALMNEHTLALAAADTVGHGEFEVVSVMLAGRELLEGQPAVVLEDAVVGTEPDAPLLAHEPVLGLGHGGVIEGARVALAAFALQPGKQLLLELLVLPIPPNRINIVQHEHKPKEAQAQILKANKKLVYQVHF